MYQPSDEVEMLTPSREPSRENTVAVDTQTASAAASSSSAAPSAVDTQTYLRSTSNMSEGSLEPGTPIFTPDNIGNFCSYPSIVRALNGYVLLTRDEFLEWMNPPALRAISRPTEQRLAHRDEEEENVTTTYSELLQNMPIEVCEGITEDYGQAQMDNITMADDNYDMLVAVQSDYKTYRQIRGNRTIEHLTKQKLEKIVGFIITEIGECKKLPRAVSVKLICAKQRTIKGSLLMGAYFDAIKNSHYDQQGILELARGYLNVSGFLSYTNMGFNKDTTLFDKDCFDDFRTLQMSVDLSEIDTATIIAMASGTKHPRAGEQDDTGIYELYKRRLTIPEELLACNNLLLKAELDKSELIEAIKQSNTPRYTTRAATAAVVEPEDLVLKPVEITLLRKLGVQPVDEGNIEELVRQLKQFRQHLVDENLSKGGSRKKKNTRRKDTRRKNTRKKNTRKKNRRRFTKKAKK
jgi:hypothetical protein